MYLQGTFTRNLAVTGVRQTLDVQRSSQVATYRYKNAINKKDK